MWNASAVSAPPRISAIGVAPRRRRVLERLDHDDPAALAEDEPVAVAVERARGVLRVVVPLRQRAHVAEGGDAHRPDRRLGAAGEDDVALAGLDQPERVVERDHRRRAGGDLGHHRAGQPVLHRQHAGAHRARQRRDRRTALTKRGPLLVVDVGPVDDLLDPAAAGVDDDPDPVALRPRLIAAKSIPASATASLPAAIANAMNRLIRRAIFGSMGDGRVEVEDLGRDLDLERRRVEALDRRVPVTPGLEVRPVGREVVADRHDRAETGHDGAASGVLAGHGVTSGRRDVGGCRTARVGL